MEDKDEFYLEPEQQYVREIIQVNQPIPLFDKPRIQQPKNIALKMIDIPKRQQNLYIPFRIKNKRQFSQNSQQNDQSKEQFYESPFTQFYGQNQCVYQKYHNNFFNKYNGATYFAGRFINRAIISDSPLQQISDLQQVLKQYYDINTSQLSAPSTNDLIFDSKFQTGNLFAVFKVSDNQYDLIMENDTNSKGNNQWFYFKVDGMLIGVEYTFNVINFTKNDSLFNYGMSPAVFSKVAHQRHGHDWSRIGKDVAYKKGPLQRQNSRRHYYKLTFKLSTKYSNDTLSVAHSYPYTFSNLKDFMNNRTSKNKDIINKIQIGRSLAKHPIYALQITLQINKKRDNRKAIIIFARQHPGQTQGSFVCEGVVDKIIGRNKQGEFLRKNYVFYVFPMVNPDGVVFGHYRTNLAGYDLNRKWDSSDKQLNCPQIVAIKSFIQEISKQREIRFILDLHGHSKKLNSFFYGNSCVQNPDAIRIYPFVCSKMNSAIMYSDCTFANQQAKKRAARVYLSYLYKLIHVYTFESSFYGYLKDGKKYEFTPKQYRELGHTLVQCLFLQLQHEVKFQQSFQFNSGKGSNSKQYINSPFVKLLNELKSNVHLLQMGSQFESGSQSRPEEMEININEIIPIVKPLTRELSIAQITQQSNQRSIIKISRKGHREIKDIKEVSKPIRNLRVMEISRVNSVLPDKYQLGLQPIRKKEQSEVITRNGSGLIKCSIESQTDNTQSIKGCLLREIQDKSLLANSSRIDSPGSKQKRYSSVIKTQNRNNIIFKIDLLSRQSMTKINASLLKQIPYKHAFSQTILTFGKDIIDRSKQSQLFPTVQTPQRPQNDLKWLRCNAIRYDTTRIGMKRQAELFLNGMVKKYFAEKDLKLKDHALSKFAEKPLTIKKKQLSIVKK